MTMLCGNRSASVACDVSGNARIKGFECERVKHSGVRKPCCVCQRFGIGEADFVFVVGDVRDWVCGDNCARAVSEYACYCARLVFVICKLTKAVFRHVVLGDSKGVIKEKQFGDR